MAVALTKFILPLIRTPLAVQLKKCHSVFGINQLIEVPKAEEFTVTHVKSSQQGTVLELIKKHYLRHHVMVQSRNMNVEDDRALDAYLTGLLKQGNSLVARDPSGVIAGFCVNYACSAVDSSNLRNFAFYRQNPHTKDLLNFIATLQDTPNLWEMFKQKKIFEIKMLAVLPEFRRRGVATLLARRSRILARDQGYRVLRMDCLNEHDYKIAERCMLQCVTKFPLHKLRSRTSPYIKRHSEHNRRVRVYVDGDVMRPEGDSERVYEVDIENVE